MMYTHEKRSLSCNDGTQVVYTCLNEVLKLNMRFFRITDEVKRLDILFKQSAMVILISVTFEFCNLIY